MIKYVNDQIWLDKSVIDRPWWPSGLTYDVTPVWYGESHPSFPQLPAETSDNSDSNSSGNGYKATPVN